MSEPNHLRALDEARSDVASARRAATDGDRHRRSQYAWSAVDAATEALADPTASRREAVAARRLLAEGLALNEPPHANHPRRHFEEQTAGLCKADRKWVDDYLAARPSELPGDGRCLGR